MDVYEERKEWVSRIKAILTPCHFKLGLVWQLQGGVSMIWYWGKSQSGFASGLTPEDAADSAIRQVFGVL